MRWINWEISRDPPSTNTLKVTSKREREVMHTGHMLAPVKSNRKKREGSDPHETPVK